MTIQNSLYGRELSEGEAASTYQPKSPILTALSNPPSNGDYLLSMGAGTLSWTAPTSDLIPEGTSKLYFTIARAKAVITGAASTAVSSDLTPTRVVISDNLGKLSASTITAGELGYLSGVTSNIQGQIASINSALGTIGDIGSLTTSTISEGSNLYYTDARARAAITGAVSPVLTTNLTASRLLVSDTGGKVSTSNVTTVEVGYLSGVTSPIQTQLAQVGTLLATTVANLTTTSVPEGSRLYFTTARATASITGAASSVVTLDLPLSKALISDSSGKVATSPVTATELSYLGGATSSLQAQISAINTTVVGLTTTAIAEGTNLYHTSGRVVSSLTGAASTIATTDLTVSKALVSTASGKVGVSLITSTELGYLGGATSNIQGQIGTINTTISGLTTNSVVEGSTNLYFTAARAVGAITGAASTIATANLTVSRVLVSDTSGKVCPSTTTAVELGYLSGVTSGLQTQLNTITGRTITAGAGLSGGGTLSTNVSLGVTFEATPSTLKAAGTASVGTANTVPRADHVHPSDTTKVDVTLMGVASGVATLDSNAKVPTTQIPAITTQVGFGGETLSVPYTGTSITLPLDISQGGTGSTNKASALSALGAQPYYPILTSIYNTAGTGFLVKDSDNTVSLRSLQVNTPLTLTNASGISGNPTISINQGIGSGLDADLLDGLHGTSYLRTDGVITHSTGTASTIRGSILAAGAGNNIDITSLSVVTGLGNTSSTHIQITTSGAVGIGDTPTAYGKVAIRGGIAGTSNASLALLTPNGSLSSRVSIAMYPTFGSGTDTNVRRAVDIVAGFNGGIWGTEYLSFNVGGGTDTALLPTERVRIDGSGNVLVGKTTTTANAGDVQISKGLTFPATQVPCSNINTLDDYKEGTWTPAIDSSTVGTGRVTNILSATFTKVGRLVSVHSYIQLSTLGTGGSGYLIITGLPYTSSGQYTAVQVGYYSNLKVAVVSLTGTLVPGSNYMSFYASTSTNTTSSILMDFNTYIQAGTVFILSAHYFSS